MVEARLVPAAAAALLAWALFFGGGASDTRLFWIGSAALLLAAALLAAMLAGLVARPRGRLAWLYVALLGLLVAWSGASMAWSVVPDRSWDGFNRGLAYLGFAIVGLFFGALVPRPARVLAAALAALLAAVIGWALLSRVLPALFPYDLHGYGSRLRRPVGYPNALALLGDVALVLGLWTASPRWRPLAARIGGALLVYGALVATLLTYSRTGVFVGAVAVVIWLACTDDRLEGIAVVGLTGAPALALSAWALSAHDLGSTATHAERAGAGALFAVLLAAGAAFVAASVVVASRRAPRDAEARRRLERRASLAVGAAVVAAVVGFAISAGGPSGWIREFSHPVEVTQSSNRLASAGTNNRWEWWKDAGRIFRKHPLEGAGAQAYDTARRPIRHSESVALEPHNTALQFLSELGIVGFLLAAGVAAVAVAGMRAMLRRAEGAERAATLALALAALVYLLHALVDYDWSFVAVTGPALLVIGALLSRPGSSRVPRRALAVAGVAVALLASLYSLAAPWIASRRVDAALALVAQAPTRAAARARSAHQFNPLSYDAFRTWALAAAAAGDENAAVLLYERGAVLQPENWETWYFLGQYQFLIGRYRRACYALDLSYRLDPRGIAGQPGGLLDQVKRRLPGCPGSAEP